MRYDQPIDKFTPNLSFSSVIKNMLIRYYKNNWKYCWNIHQAVWFILKRRINCVCRTQRRLLVELGPLLKLIFTKILNKNFTLYVAMRTKNGFATATKIGSLPARSAINLNTVTQNTIMNGALDHSSSARCKFDVCDAASKVKT